MQISSPVKEIDTLSKLLLVDLNVSIWSGRKKLRTEDLGAGVTLPPSELASLGSKKIINSDELKEFENLKRRAVRLLELNGVRFLGGYGLPDGVAPEVAAELEDIKRKFEDQRVAFIKAYDSNFDAWVNKWANPQWRSAVLSAKTPKDVVAHKFSFRFTLCRVAPDTSNPSIAKGLAQEVNGLSGQLFREIADAAEDLLDNSFVGKDSVSRKAVSSMLKMHKKLSSLAFLNPGVSLVADYMTNVIGKLPKSGPYKGSDFQDLLSLILTLSDETKILKMAGLFQKSNTDAPGAFVDPTLQLSDDTTPDFSDFNILDVETAFDVLAGAMDSALVAESSATSFADLMAGADLTSLNVNELASLAHEVQNAAIEAASEKADVDEVAPQVPSNEVFAHVVAADTFAVDSMDFCL